MGQTIDLAKQFSTYPFGRYPKHGPDNGERFRTEYLEPALRNGGVVSVDISGARGLAPSFLEEAFGGLLRSGFTKADLDQRLVIHSAVDPSLVDEVKGYIDEEAARQMATY